MKRKYLYSAAVMVMIFVPALFSTGSENLLTMKVTQDKLAYFPVPKDNLNYLFLQSIGNDTSIVIGDFSGPEKKIILIVDKKNDNKIDSVYEYFPLTKDLKKKSESNSKFFTKDIAKLKKDIIDGIVYQGNYTDKMESLKILENILKNFDTNSLNSDVYGFVIKSYETDKRDRHSAVFAYGKNAGGYYLQFKTMYYRKDFKTEQEPVLKYSVYCKDTNDPVVQETVENLFKIKQPIVNFDKTDSLQKSK